MTIKEHFKIDFEPKYCNLFCIQHSYHYILNPLLHEKLKYDVVRKCDSLYIQGIGNTYKITHDENVFYVIYIEVIFTSNGQAKLIWLPLDCVKEARIGYRTPEFEE